MLCIGIMTGNSLDAVDAVITEFTNTNIKDICGFSQPIPIDLADKFRHLKSLLTENNGDIDAIAANLDYGFDALHDEYVNLVADTVKKLLKQADLSPSAIDVIGFHGQTCAHCPPSINPQDNYTLQIGSGQMLSDLTSIPVVFDFRSDDLMNGGEAAPLAPVHNLHLAHGLKSKGVFPLAFCNGGNTGNIAIIYDDKVIGWDTGPFNHFVDYLTRSEKNETCDWNGKYGKQGSINLPLLKELFNHSVQTQKCENFLLKNPPKSSDPAWYKIIPALTSKQLSFADRLRTAEFFSAYILAYALRYSPIGTPNHFLIFGGGWNNPIIKEDFQNLLTGRTDVLPEHKEIFEKIKNPLAQIEWSDKYGYNGKYMEARIFADMARCKLTNEPFSYPETTGCKTPTVGGILVHPGDNNPRRWSRAAKGWTS